MKKTLWFIFWLSFFVPESFAVSFEAPQTLSNTEGASRVRLDAGPNGDFHIAFLKESKIYYSRFRNGDWCDPLMVADSGKDSVPIQYADVAGDKNGDAYIVWVNEARSRLFFATVHNASEVTLESRPVRCALRTEVTVDALDTIRVMYRDKSPEENRLLSRKVAQSEWESVELIPTDGGGDGQRRPSIEADQLGNLYYGYRWMTGGSSDRRLAFRIYDGNTGKWSAIVQKFRGAQKPWGPQIFMDKNNQPHMVFNDGYETAYVNYRSPDGTVKRIGKAAGEDGWPSSIVVTDAGEKIIAASSMSDYCEPHAEGEVTYFVADSSDFSGAIDIDPNAHPKAWGSVAAFQNFVMLTYVADDHILWSVSKPATTSIQGQGFQPVPKKLYPTHYPNPFNPSIHIRYQLASYAHVNLSVFNVLGQKVKTLIEQDQPMCGYDVIWDGMYDDGAQAPSGVYIYHLSVEADQKRVQHSGKMIRMK